MTLPYKRYFTSGRGSEQFYNEELHKDFTVTKHLADTFEKTWETPEGVMTGQLWRRDVDNTLRYYDKPSNSWPIVFDKKFQIVDRITNDLPDGSPVLGQLWLYNDALFYWSGSQWTPVKALEYDGSQFNLAMFDNFFLASPLWTIGNMVVEDKDVADYETALKQIIQGKIDAYNNAVQIQSTKWDINHVCNTTVKDIEDLQLTGKAQLLVPNITVDRVFLNDLIDFEYEAPNRVHIQYEREYIAEKVPSLVHVNPGRLTSITKRCVKVDKTTPKIELSAANTEFYGFYAGDPYGHFLRPDTKANFKGDYTVMSDGIYLTYDAAQNYDYVVAITYDFTWYRTTGKLTTYTNTDDTTSYFVQDYIGPMNVFVEGLNLEDPHYTEDNISQTITIDYKTNNLEVGMLRSPYHEYGYVRQVDLNNRGIVKTLKEFTHPMLFVNGEALHPALGDFEFEGNTMYVPDASVNMAYNVIELYDKEKEYDMSCVAGWIDNTNVLINGTVVIYYPLNVLDDQDDVVLFIDGLLVKKEEIIRDTAGFYVTAPGLSVGQSYILLRDKYHYFYDEDKLIPAVPLGNLSETLVYVNGHLICNDPIIATSISPDQAKEVAAHNEVRFFITSELDKSVGEFRIFNRTTEEWDELTSAEIAGIKAFAYSYENTTRSVKFLLNLSTADDIHIYSYHYANAIEHSLIIRNLPDTNGNPGVKVIQNEADFTIKETFVPNIGSLSVYVNGIRQFHVTEYEDGTGFRLPEPVTGVVTYVIEQPENGATVVAQREVLTKDNIIPNTINVYKTTKPLYPGRVLVYINGVRQPQGTFVVLDNYTIMITDPDDMLIGNENNFPEEHFIVDGKHKTITHTASDEILVEVKQDYDRREEFLNLSGNTSFKLDPTDYGISLDILETPDEILFYLDGLFLGLRHLIGYRKDPWNGKIVFMDADFVDRIVSDPLYTYLMQDPENMDAYKKSHDGNEYEKKKHTLIVEWR